MYLKVVTHLHFVKQPTESVPMKIVFGGVIVKNYRNQSLNNLIVLMLNE
jgi:hypothetical protein